jgi:hypothetical protein
VLLSTLSSDDPDWLLLLLPLDESLLEDDLLERDWSRGRELDRRRPQEQERRRPRERDQLLEDPDWYVSLAILRKIHV